MISLAIDGACRRNGKPDCVSAGGIFSVHYDDAYGTIISTCRMSASEKQSTNQRGEMLALLYALRSVICSSEDVRIITDSEYLFNAMSKQWVDRWVHNGWCTASGEPVKNADLWQQIYEAASMVQSEVNYYHIKGHVIPFGKVTAQNFVDADPSGKSLFIKVSEQYDRLRPTKAEALENAQVLSEKNNGFRLAPDVLRDFVVSNVVADIVATQAVEEADRKS